MATVPTGISLVIFWRNGAPWAVLLIVCELCSLAMVVVMCKTGPADGGPGNAQLEGGRDPASDRPRRDEPVVAASWHLSQSTATALTPVALHQKGCC